MEPKHRKLANHFLWFHCSQFCTLVLIVYGLSRDQMGGVQSGFGTPREIPAPKSGLASFFWYPRYPCFENPPTHFLKKYPSALALRLPFALVRRRRLRPGLGGVAGGRRCAGPGPGRPTGLRVAGVRGVSRLGWVMWTPADWIFGLSLLVETAIFHWTQKVNLFALVTK